jgi:hypothetical protein
MESGRGPDQATDDAVRTLKQTANNPFAVRQFPMPSVRCGSSAASPVARWRGSYAPDIGLEGLKTGAAGTGQHRTPKISKARIPF